MATLSVFRDAVTCLECGEDLPRVDRTRACPCGCSKFSREENACEIQLDVKGSVDPVMAFTVMCAGEHFPLSGPEEMEEAAKLVLDAYHTFSIPAGQGYLQRVASGYKS